MRISRDKTEVMVTNREPIQCNIELDGETLRQVEQFKYLGSIFVREGGCKEDVKTRCLKAAQVFYQLSPILGHKEISMITKTQIIKAVFTPTLLYQSENWTLTSKERQMLSTTEMRCLRKAAGKTRMDKIRNEEIRGRPRNRLEDDVPRWYNEMEIPMTYVNNLINKRRPIVYPLDADGRRVRLK